MAGKERGVPRRVGYYLLKENAKRIKLQAMVLFRAKLGNRHNVRFPGWGIARYHSRCVHSSVEVRLSVFRHCLRNVCYIEHSGRYNMASATCKNTVQSIRTAGMRLARRASATASRKVESKQAGR